METNGSVTVSGWNRYTEEGRPSRTQAEAAAEAWALARDRYLGAMAAHGEALKTLDEARVEEEKAWSALVNAAERGAQPPVANRPLPPNANYR